MSMEVIAIVVLAIFVLLLESRLCRIEEKLQKGLGSVHKWQVAYTDTVIHLTEDLKTLSAMIGKTQGEVDAMKPKKKIVSEQVNHPAHYNMNGKETIVKIEEELGLEGALHFCLGNEIKYQDRAPYKDDMKTDLEKARWYKNKSTEYKARIEAQKEREEVA